MTSVKITFRPSAFKEEEGTLCFRLVLGRRIRRIGTGYRLFLSEWDECQQSVVIRPQSDDERKNYLTGPAEPDRCGCEAAEPDHRLFRAGAPQLYV